MELLQLLKTLGDQSSQANMQEQINQLRLAIIDFAKFNSRIQIFMSFALGIYIIIHEIRFFCLGKRLKKAEEIIAANQG